jgi:hypothetical protein
VTSRSATRALEGSQADPQSVGERLGVRYMLTGAIRHSDHQSLGTGDRQQSTVDTDPVREDNRRGVHIQCLKSVLVDGDERRLNVLWFVNGHGHQRDAKPLSHVVHELLHANRRARIAGRVQDADALDPRLELPQQFVVFPGDLVERLDARTSGAALNTALKRTYVVTFSARGNRRQPPGFIPALSARAVCRGEHDSLLEGEELESNLL